MRNLIINLIASITPRPQPTVVLIPIRIRSCRAGLRQR
jgi:hypothetical protein